MIMNRILLPASLHHSSEQIAVLKITEMLETLLTNILNLEGPNHVKVPGLYARIAMNHHKMGDFQKAVNNMEKAMNAFQTRYLENDPVLVSNKMVLGCMYQDIGRYQEAIHIFNTCRSIIEEDRNPQYPLLSLALWNLARVYQDIGNYYQAIKLFDQILKMKEEEEGLSGEYLVPHQLDLAVAYRKAAHYYQALELLNKVLRNDMVTLSPHDDNIIEAKKELVMNYWELGRYAEAATKAKEVAAAESIIKGVDAIELAASFYFQFRCYLELGELENSRATLERVYHLYKRHYGEKDERTEEMKDALGQFSKSY